MRSTRSIVGATVVAMALLASACGSQPAPAAKGTLTLSSTDFSENATLANVYGRALKEQGYTINYRLRLGSREIVAPALDKGEIDMYPGYAATDLEYFNNKAGEATVDVKLTAEKLRTRLAAKGLKALDAAPAVDQNALVVTKATADKYNLKKASDLTPVAGQLVFGTTAQCAARPFCLPGLKRVYNITFKDVKALDTVGPITRAALERGDVQVALLLSTDGFIGAKGWVLLEDDKHLQLADNVIPIIRDKVANDEVTRILNGVSAKLTTDDLIKLNQAVDVDKQDPPAAAEKWLKDKGLIKK